MEELTSYLVATGVSNLLQLRDWAAKTDLTSSIDQARASGVGAGIGEATLRYLAMLAGNDEQVKPDRHILGFLEDTVGRAVDARAAVGIVQDAAHAMGIAPRQLGHSIWYYQRKLKRANRNSR